MGRLHFTCEHNFTWLLAAMFAFQQCAMLSCRIVLQKPDTVKMICLEPCTAAASSITAQNLTLIFKKNYIMSPSHLACLTFASFILGMPHAHRNLRESSPMQVNSSWSWTCEIEDRRLHLFGILCCQLIFALCFWYDSCHVLMPKQTSSGHC